MTAPGVLTPCQKHPDRFTPRMDNRYTRAECRDCHQRLNCALLTMAQIEKGLHPTGVRAGLWFPDDKRADGPHSSPQRRHAINQLRSVIMVLSRTIKPRQV